MNARLLRRWAPSITPDLLVLVPVMAVLLLSPACSGKGTEPTAPAASHPELAKASRVDTNGWINVHLEGTPREIGFQHGWLLATRDRRSPEGPRATSSRDRRSATGRSSGPRRNACSGRSSSRSTRRRSTASSTGLKARLPRTKYDRVDITVLNGWIELAWYYVPYLDEMAKKGAGDNKAPGYCSAFIATGSWTEGGGIVIGHNNWVDYIIGSRWNVIADIVPAAGQPHPDGLLAREPSTAATTSS